MEDAAIKRVLEAVETLLQSIPKRQKLEPIIEGLSDVDKTKLAEFRRNIRIWITATKYLPWTLVFEFLVAVGAAEAFDFLKSQHKYWRRRVKYEFPVSYQYAHTDSYLNMKEDVFTSLFAAYEPGRSRFAQTRDLRKPISTTISPWFLFYQKLQYEVSEVRIAKSPIYFNDDALVYGNVRYMVANEPIQEPPLVPNTWMHPFVLTFKRKLILGEIDPETETVLSGTVAMWANENAFRMTSNSFSDVTEKLAILSTAELLQTKARFEGVVSDPRIKIIGNYLGKINDPEGITTTGYAVARYVVGLDEQLSTWPARGLCCRTGMYVSHLKVFKLVSGATIPLDIPEHLEVCDVLLPGSPFAPIVLVREHVVRTRIYDFTNSSFICNDYTFVNGWLTYDFEFKWFAINLRRYAECKAIGDWTLHAPLVLTPVVFQDSHKNVLYRTLLQTRTGYCLLVAMGDSFGIHRYSHHAKELIACDVCHQPSSQECETCSQKLCSTECSALAHNCK